jgi:arylsulfatase A-like enzyme
MGGVGPLLIAQSAQFLGKDVSQVAAGILGFYPWTAVFEVLRVLLAVALVLAGLAFPWVVVSTLVDSRTLSLVCFPLMPVVNYILWLLGTVLKYPSFFNSFLPLFVQNTFYRAAFLIDPSVFWWASALTFLCSFGILAYKKSRELLTFRFSSLSKARLLASFVGVSLFIGLFVIRTRSLVADLSTIREKNSAPNVLVIAVDSLRVDRLRREDLVPSLIELLSDPQVVKFNDHYVGVPRTFPSWVELVSGTPAPVNGIRHMFPGFGVRTGEFSGFVSDLRDAGYDTQVWSDFAGDIFPRFMGGFKEIHTPNMNLKTMIRLSIDQSLPFFLPILMSTPFREFFSALKQSPAFADPTHITNELVEKMSQGDNPWLKVVFYSGAHFPYAAPHPFYTKFTRADYRGKFLFEKNPELGGLGEGLTDEDKVQIRSLYDGAIHAVDKELGRLFRSLKSKGLWDSTLIVITADHGEDLYEQGRVQGHGEHLRGENVLKVPFIVKLPANFMPKLSEIEDTTRSIDVSPTILEICGVKKSSIYGKSLLSKMTKDSSENTPRAAYSETGIWFSRSGEGFFQSQRLDYPGISRLLSFDQGFSGEVVLDPRFERIVVTAKHRSLVYQDFKIIYVPTSAGVRYELYNRRLDPENLTDLSKVDPIRLAEMRQRLFDVIKKMEKNVAFLDDFVVPQ